MCFCPRPGVKLRVDVGVGSFKSTPSDLNLSSRVKSVGVRATVDLTELAKLVSLKSTGFD